MSDRQRCETNKKGGEGSELIQIGIRQELNSEIHAIPVAVRSKA